ncbi:MAG: transketolase [Gaiellaceae bacterium]|jgi:transketolase
MTETDIRQQSILAIRTLAMDAVQKANSGHPGTAMALAPIAYLLYTKHLRHNPSDPGWPNRDRFILSAGHACILQYAALHLSGYDLSLEDLKQFRQWNSRTPGHPEHFVTPGVETTTGPLGQGFANAVGFGLAERFLADRFNRLDHAIVDHNVYVICSDGDLMEGISSEAASVAGQLGLGKLIYLYDSNRISIDGATSISFSVDDPGRRLEAQGWHVQRVADANDLAELDRAIEAAKAERQRPSLIVVRSHIAYGAPHLVDTAKAHGAPLGADEVRAAKIVLGADPDKEFFVPEEVYAHMSQLARGAALEAEWCESFESWSMAFPELREDWDHTWRAEPKSGWQEALPEFESGKEMATRDAGREVMQAIKPYTPTMVGGSADLAESVRTEFVGGGLFSSSHSGRNIAFGVREHGMGAIVNGIALHGGMVKPYGSTFLIFSDYMRPAVRLSALGRIPVIWVYSHDSIGVGEDGPTHQPIEQLMTLREIPNLWLMRPADANETVFAWKTALERPDGPVALALTRQKLPVLDRSELSAASGVERGAYVLWETEGANGHPDLIFIATGSEVAATLTAARELQQQGVRSRVVSMPCWELFELQDDEYQESVLPSEVQVRLSVEAGISLGWKRWVGDSGASVAIDHFAASAPGGELMKQFGFTAESIVAKAQALLARVS